jgi:hypothetical protein
MLKTLVCFGVEKVYCELPLWRTCCDDMASNGQKLWKIWGLEGNVRFGKVSKRN